MRPRHLKLRIFCVSNFPGLMLANIEAHRVVNWSHLPDADMCTLTCREPTCIGRYVPVTYPGIEELVALEDKVRSIRCISSGN